MSDKSFAFIKADFDTLIDAIESQLGWLTTKEGDSQRQLVAKLKGSSNEVISFVSVTHSPPYRARLLASSLLRE
jgi:hypothetical protein